MQYKWKRTPKGKVDAQVAGEHIEEIKEKRGGITPQLLVIEAKKKRSPLHNCFEWDDSAAAEQYRIVQAREILRYLVVVIELETENEEEIYVRGFVAPLDTDEDSQTSYLTISEVMADEDLDRAYKQQILRELKAIKHKSKSYDEFSKVNRAIEEVKI